MPVSNSKILLLKNFTYKIHKFFSRVGISIIFLRNLPSNPSFFPNQSYNSAKSLHLYVNLAGIYPKNSTPHRKHTYKTNDFLNLICFSSNTPCEIFPQTPAFFPKQSYNSAKSLHLYVILAGIHAQIPPMQKKTLTALAISVHIFTTIKIYTLN